MQRFSIVFLIAILLASCASPVAVNQPTVTVSLFTSTALPTATSVPTQTPVPTTEIKPTLPASIPDWILHTLGVASADQLQIIGNEDNYRVIANGYGADFKDSENGKEWVLTFKPVESTWTSPDAIVRLDDGVTITFRTIIDRSVSEHPVTPLHEVYITDGGAKTIVRGVLQDLWSLQSGEELSTIIEWVKKGEVAPETLQLSIDVEDTTTPNGFYEGNEILNNPGLHKIEKTVHLFPQLGGDNIKNPVNVIELVYVDGEQWMKDIKIDNETTAALNGTSSSFIYAGGMLRYDEKNNSLQLIVAPAQNFVMGMNTVNQVTMAVNLLHDILLSDSKVGWVTPRLNSASRNMSGPYLNAANVAIRK